MNHKKFSMKRLILLLVTPLVFTTIGYGQFLLFDQTANVLSGGSLSRIHDNQAQSNFDIMAAEEFVVPAGQLWQIDSLVALGTYNSFTPPPAVPVIFIIFGDTNGLPNDNDTVWVDTIANGDINLDGNLEVFFEEHIQLNPNTYWFSAAVYTSAVPWYWNRINEELGIYSGHWQNQGGGYAGSGVCGSWQPNYQCYSLINDSSYAFQLYGCPGPEIKPDIADLGGDTTACEVFNLSASSTNVNANFTWSTGDSGVSSILVDTSGLISVTVTDTVSGCANSDVIDITLVLLDPPVLPDDTICANSSIPATFALPANNCPTCVGSWPDGSVGPFYSTFDAGPVNVTVTDTVSGCSVQGGGEVTVNPALLNIVEGPIHNVCKGDTLTLSTTQTLTNPIWLLSEFGIYSNISNQATAQITLGGTVAVQGEDADGCEVYDTASVTILELPLPNMTVKGGVGGTVTVQAESGFEDYSWSTGGSGSSIKVESNGAYYVTVTDANGCQGFNYAVVNNVGVNELFEAGFKLYPNPAIHEVFIQWPDAWVEDSEISVMDIAGRVMIQEGATSTTQSIDLRGLSSGKYVVRLTTPEGVKSSTIVVAN